MQKTLLTVLCLWAICTLTLFAQETKEGPGGISIEVLKEGNGEKPTLGQEVEMHVVMKNAEGTVMMSTRDMGITMFDVYEEGTDKESKEQYEIMSMMSVGSHYRLKIPKAGNDDPSLAALPGDHFVYEVEMLSFADAKPNGANALGEKIKAEGLDAGMAMYKALQADNPEGYVFREWDINRLGYELMGMGKMDEAIAILKLNTEIHPKSANCFDSLGDVYLAKGDKENAKAAYEKALAINPNYISAEKLKGLE